MIPPAASSWIVLCNFLRKFCCECHGNLRWQKVLREALRRRRRKLRPFLVFNKRELLLRLHLLRLLQLLHLLHALRLSSGERRTLWAREKCPKST